MSKPEQPIVKSNSSEEILTAINHAELSRLRDENRRLRDTIKRIAIASHVKNKVKVKPILPSKKRRTKDDFIRIIIPDTHGSLLDRLAASAFLADLETLNADEIVLLGDHIDCGGHLAEHHVLGYVAQTAYSYAEDTASAKSFLDAVRAAAPGARIHYLEGNHERRVETWCITKTLRHPKDSEMLRLVYAPEYVLGLKDRGITYYRQGEFYCGLAVPGTIKLGKCFFWHGTSIAADAARVNVRQIGGNVVYGHTHRDQGLIIRPVESGGIGAWCPGCLCQLQPLWNHTRPADWTHGYAIQCVARSGKFLHLNIPILGGESLLRPLSKKIK